MKPGTARGILAALAAVLAILAVAVGLAGLLVVPLVTSGAVDPAWSGVLGAVVGLVVVKALGGLVLLAWWWGRGEV